MRKQYEVFKEKLYLKYTYKSICDIDIESLDHFIPKFSRYGSILVLQLNPGQQLHKKDLTLFVNQIDTLQHLRHSKKSFSLCSRACRYGHLLAFHLLVERGAVLASGNRAGATPLHLACQFGRTEMVKVGKLVLCHNKIKIRIIVVLVYAVDGGKCLFRKRSIF